MQARLKGPGGEGVRPMQARLKGPGVSPLCGSEWARPLLTLPLLTVPLFTLTLIYFGPSLYPLPTSSAFPKPDPTSSPTTLSILPSTWRGEMKEVRESSK